MRESAAGLFIVTWLASGVAWAQPNYYTPKQMEDRHMRQGYVAAPNAYEHPLASSPGADSSRPRTSDGQPRLSPHDSLMQYSWKQIMERCSLDKSQSLPLGFHGPATLVGRLRDDLEEYLERRFPPHFDDLRQCFERVWSERGSRDLEVAAYLDDAEGRYRESIETGLYRPPSSSAPTPAPPVAAVAVPVAGTPPPASWETSERASPGRVIATAEYRYTISPGWERPDGAGYEFLRRGEVDFGVSTTQLPSVLSAQGWVANRAAFNRKFYSSSSHGGAIRQVEHHGVPAIDVEFTLERKPSRTAAHWVQAFLVRYVVKGTRGYELHCRDVSKSVSSRWAWNAELRRACEEQFDRVELTP